MKRQPRTNGKGRTKKRAAISRNSFMSADQKAMVNESKHALDAYTRKLEKSPEIALKGLVDAGIYSSSGHLIRHSR